MANIQVDINNDEIDVTITPNDIDVSLARVGPQGPAGQTGAADNVIAQPTTPQERPSGAALQDGDVWINTSVTPHIVNTYDTTTSTFTPVEDADITGTDIISRINAAGVTGRIDEAHLNLDNFNIDSIPFFVLGTTYVTGALVGHRIPANTFVVPDAFSTPPTRGVPESEVSKILQYIGDGTTPAAALAEQRSGQGGVAVMSADWAIASDGQTIFYDGFNYVEDAIVDSNGHAYRARRNVLRGSGLLPTPVDGDDWQLLSTDAAVEVGRNTADTADVPIFAPGINRTEWDLFNRINVGFPLQASGDTQFGDRTQPPIFINSDATTGYDQAAAMRNLFDVRFNNLTDVNFEADGTTFIEPRFNGLTLFTAPFRGVSSAQFDANSRVLSVEVLTNSTYQRGELESTFANGTAFLFNSSITPDLSIDITGTCQAPQFFEGDALINSRVELSFQLDNVQAQIDAITGFTDGEGITWDIRNLNNNGIYTFSINGATDAQQRVFQASLLQGVEVQHNRVINHQWAWYDQRSQTLQVTDAQEMRDQLQTQPTPDLLSVATQFPTAPVPVGSTEHRGNQVVTVTGLDNFLGNANGRSLVEAFTPSNQNPLPTVEFSGWIIKNTLTNEMWFWNPSTDALADNLPRSAGQYIRMGGDTSVNVVTSIPVTAPDVNDESNIRILTDRSAVYLFVGPDGDDWVNILGGGGVGTGQLGYSIEQVGDITALATEPANTYRWHAGQSELNFSGLNGFGYLAPTNPTLTGASASDQLIFTASGQFINSTGGSRTIRSFDIDLDARVLGDGDVVRIDPVVIHAVSLDATAIPPTYSSYTPIRVDAQETSIAGVRTFDFQLPSNVVLAAGDAISLTLTDLVSNQSTNITGVRWSSTTDSWLNTVYPISSGTGGNTRFIQDTDTPTSYAGSANRVVRVNGAATGLEFDPITNLYPNGGTLFNDTTIPSAEYVLDAVDPTFHYTMPLLTRDLVANQRYDVSFTSILDNADGFSIRGDDILFNGQRVSAIYRWNNSLNRWIQNDTDSTLNLQNGVDALNQFQVSFDAATLTNIRNHHVIETAEAMFNQNNAMVRNGIRLPFDTNDNPDDHQQILQNEQNIASNSSRLDALENEVHNLEENGTRIRTQSFHDVTLENPTIDEVIGYHASHSAAGVFTDLALNQAVSPAQAGNVTAGSHSLPPALERVISSHIEQVFASMVALTDEFRRTNVGANSDFTWNGNIPFPYAVLRLSVDAQTFVLPLRVTSTRQGDIVHSLIDEWPVDDEITWSHISVQWFINPPGTDDSSINLGPVPADTPDGRQQLAVPMTATDRTLFYNSSEEFVTIHFTDQNGQTRNINVDVPETAPTSFPNAPTWQDGFVYALVTLESTDEVQPGLNSHILINIGANPFAPVETIPLSLWKANIWFGTEGLSGTTEFSTDQGLRTVSYTPYTSNGQTLWFVDDLNITADGNFIANGDGIITQGDASLAANVRANNSVNYIG